MDSKENKGSKEERLSEEILHSENKRNKKTDKIGNHGLHGLTLEPLKTQRTQIFGTTGKHR